MARISDVVKNFHFAYFVSGSLRKTTKGWRKIKFAQLLTAYAVWGGWVGGSPCRLGNCTNFRCTHVWPDRMGEECDFYADGIAGSILDGRIPCKVFLYCFSDVFSVTELELERRSKKKLREVEVQMP